VGGTSPSTMPVSNHASTYRRGGDENGIHVPAVVPLQRRTRTSEAEALLISSEVAPTLLFRRAQRGSTKCRKHFLPPFAMAFRMAPRLDTLTRIHRFRSVREAAELWE
jgi:hypothetical protein